MRGVWVPQGSVRVPIGRGEGITGRGAFTKRVCWQHDRHYMWVMTCNRRRRRCPYTGRSLKRSRLHMGGSNFMFALYTIVYAALLGQQLLKSAFHSRVYHAMCSENCVLSKEDQQSVNEAEEQSVVAAQTQHTHTHTCTVVAVFFLSLVRSSLRSSIFSFRLWFSILSCSKSMRWSPSASSSCQHHQE